MALGTHLNDSRCLMPALHVEFEEPAHGNRTVPPPNTCGGLMALHSHRNLPQPFHSQAREIRTAWAKQSASSEWRAHASGAVYAPQRAIDHSSCLFAPQRSCDWEHHRAAKRRPRRHFELCATHAEGVAKFLAQRRTSLVRSSPYFAPFLFLRARWLRRQHVSKHWLTLRAFC